MHDVTSLSLLERMRRDDDSEVWSRFMAIYSPLLERWLRSRGVPGDVAADVQQEVLLKVHKEIQGFQHNGRTGAFRAWLRTVMAHRLRTIQRQLWRDEPSQRPDWADVADELASEDSAITRIWNAEHDAYLVKRLLELVASQFQEASLQAFRRVVLNEEDPASVAADLGLSVNAVRIAQSRVLAALRRVGEGLID